MRLVILGYGYSAEAVAREIRPMLESLAVTARSADKVARLSAAGLAAIAFDGETCSGALADAIGAATHLLVSIPPGEAADPVINACESVIAGAPRLERIAYLSTIGVYGDHGGDWIDEAAELRAASLRSKLRVIAERAWMVLAGNRGIDLGVFRLAGIYGPGRSAIDNLRAGTARRIVKPGQVFNRIHAGDIAGAVSRALTHPGPLGILNLTDDEPCPPQDVVAFAAELLGMAPPPETPFGSAVLSPMARSFYAENKRVSNARIKHMLGYALRYPTYREGLRACL